MVQSAALDQVHSTEGSCLQCGLFPFPSTCFPCGLGTQNPPSHLHLLSFSRWDSEVIRTPATSETISRLSWANTFLEFVTRSLPGMMSRVVLCPCAGLELSDLTPPPPHPPSWGIYGSPDGLTLGL